MGTDRARSITPPNIRAVKAQGEVMTNIISMLCELAVVAGAVYLRSSGGITEESFMWVAGAALVGPAVSRVRGGGKAAVSTATLALGVLALKKVTGF